MGLLLIGAGLGAAGMGLWMLSTRRAAERQRAADMADIRAARMQAQAAHTQLQGWREAAHQRELQLAYLHGMAAGCSHADRAQQPPVQVVDGYAHRPAVGRQGTA